MVPVFEEGVIRAICAYDPQVGRLECEKDQFYNDMASEWDLQNPGEVVGKGTSTDMLADGLMVLKVCMEHMEFAKEMLREDYSSFVI